ncbi:MAG: energy transducer TonB [Vulcanimicrobiaceae bacterium]
MLLAIAFAMAELVTPAPSPAACTAPYRNATVIPDRFLDAVFEAAAPEAQLVLSITVAPDGTAKDVTVQDTSNGALLEGQKATEAAKRLHFKPKIVNCQAVEGKYLLRVTGPSGGF